MSYLPFHNALNHEGYTSLSFKFCLWVKIPVECLTNKRTVFRTSAWCLEVAKEKCFINIARKNALFIITLEKCFVDNAWKTLYL